MKLEQILKRIDSASGGANVRLIAVSKNVGVNLT